MSNSNVKSWNISNNKLQVDKRGKCQRRLVVRGHFFKALFGVAVAQEEEQSATNQKVGGSTSPGHNTSIKTLNPTLPMHLSVYERVWMGESFEWSARLEKHYASTVHLPFYTFTFWGKENLFIILLLRHTSLINHFLHGKQKTLRTFVMT